ncbi:MAG: hypothetical protein PHQ80_02605 [Candidatus ainarchaeum sp.]|nr:hypothetical protein [Candidatus ainarchaeum sp.]MDD5096677.1 hypothetical protein [Candidatus ainarchaeum sp.]
MQQRKLAIYIVLLIIAAVVIAVSTKFYETKVLSDDAEEYVLEDLRAKNPNADTVGIISWENRVNVDGSSYFEIKASASEGLSTPCPKRTHYQYFYPEQNFVPNPPERVVSGCTVCEGMGCVIAFPEEAIIASHTNSGTSAVEGYIQRYGDTVPSVKQVDGEGWTVTWRSPSASYGYKVEMESNGDISSISRN